MNEKFQENAAIIIEKYRDQTVTKAYLGEYYYNQDKEMDYSHLQIEFADNTYIRISDNAQHCCEHRYITCEDDLTILVGEKLLKIESKPVVYLEGEEAHECVFIEIISSGGTIQLCTHNEHNGFYGGFNLRIVEGKNE